MINYDWKFIKAADIFSLLSSFKPTRGQILKVEVFKSEFGKKRMAEELEHGPQGIWKDKGIVEEVTHASKLKNLDDEDGEIQDQRLKEKWIVHETQKIGIDPILLR